MTETQLRKLASLNVQQFIYEQLLANVYRENENKEEYLRVAKQLEDIHYKKLFLLYESKMEQTIENAFMVRNAVEQGMTTIATR